MKRPLIYLKRDQWEVVFHPLHHLSCHNWRKASFKVHSGGTETGEDHYEPINYLFTRPAYSPARGLDLGAKEIGKGSLMSTSKSSGVSSGPLVAIVTGSLPAAMMASIGILSGA